MDRSEIVAALGPTNTGKTYRAIQRLLEHESGMIGLPLRLLAREVYDKIKSLIGAAEVALVTGEEKLIPSRPRYWVCTVEAMPVDREVDFLAVDEIQLAAHLERGHIFTERLLSARGRKETWFMGAEAMRPLIERLVPTAQFRRFPRLSSLRAERPFTLGTLPRRSAVVAFSAAKVYEIAEKLKARKGGAAIVLGALSPRARNAQVELYQSGEVDYLVATDAIGMGLNLDIDRVTFAETRKFDGQLLRDLDASELSQIAGRAGRHQRDGSFGTYDRPALPYSIERAIETHRFDTIRSLVWRNYDLDFSSPQRLLQSLLATPSDPALTLVQHPEDTATLFKLLTHTPVSERLGSESRLRLLWEVCQIPDYRRLLVDEHAHLVGELFVELADNGAIEPGFILPRLERLRRHSGDIEAIMDRIKAVRTWTYVAHQGSWVDPRHQLDKVASRIEDELSDDLHQALLERFVQKKKRVIVPAATGAGPARRDGHRSDFKSQLLALSQSMTGPAPEASRAQFDTPLERFHVEPLGRISVDGEGVGLLRAGQSLWRPRSVSVIEGGSAWQKRLDEVVTGHVEKCLGGFLAKMPEADFAAERGLAYQLRHSLGATLRDDAEPLWATMDHKTRGKWQAQGLVLGQYVVFLRASVRPGSIRHRLPLVFAYYFDKHSPRCERSLLDGSLFLQPELAGRPALDAGRLPHEVWWQLGYAVLADQAVRFDIVERLLCAADEARDWTHLVATSTGLKKRAARAVAGRLRALSEDDLSKRRSSSNQISAGTLWPRPDTRALTGS